MRIERASSSMLAGRPSISYGVHSSNTMTISEFSERWMRIDSSGVRNRRAPSMGEANFTPSSVILRMPCRLKTWKPPESVRMGLSHCMKPCRPPCFSMMAVPGRSHRWKVLPSTICAPMSSSSCGSMALTLP
ncbi:Uncharacterised protein [Bordetella pertussis]|nr:Uncharacterised protein [Bordetella pertussis]CPN72124.1 Uncharacterised protein [Bordetella pertussis]